MRSIARTGLVVGFAVAVCTAACLDNASIGPSRVLTLDGIVQDLRQQGMTVASAGSEPRESFPFFSVQGKRLIVNGDNVYVFEYVTDTIATKEASTVAPSGTPIGTTQTTWISPPRFYKKDRFILLYVGTAPEVVRALDAAFGKPFAGG